MNQLITGGRTCVTISFLLFTIGGLFCQVRIHAHNDYQHPVPFWGALSAGCTSIEVDVVLKNDTLFVAHEEESIRSDRLFVSTYLEPLETSIKQNYLQSSIVLLIDLKTDAYQTLPMVQHAIERFKTLIEAQQSGLIQFVISGNRPKPVDFSNYPSYLSFDYQSLEPIEESALEKIGMISLPFYRFSNWDGRGEIPQKDQISIQQAVGFADKNKLPFRFWAIPDTEVSWQTMHDLGVTYINTDKVKSCVLYFYKE